MGIRGLTKYIDNNKLYKDEVFDSKPLIVDGNALMQVLMSKAPGREYGGDYGAHYDHLDSFFKKVKNKKIEMFIVMDGGKNSEIKLKTILYRRRDQINNLKNGKGDLPLPLFMSSQFKEVLKANQIPFVICEGEADLYVASIAKKMNGIAVTNDSDFFLFDIPNGVIKLDDLWKFIDGNDNKVPLYKRENLASLLKVYADFLPCLALVLGNDYSNKDYLKLLWSKIDITDKDDDEIKIQKIVHFINKNSIVGSDEQILQQLCDDNEEMKNQLQKEIDQYRVVQLTENEPLLELPKLSIKTMVDIRNDNDTSVFGYLKGLLRAGILDAYIFDILKEKHEHFTCVQIFGCIEDLSPVSFSRQIRKNLYSILFSYASPAIIHLTEYSREVSDYVSKPVTITPKSQDLFKLLDEQLSNRQEFILNIINVNVNLDQMVDGGSALYLLALKYCSKKMSIKFENGIVEKFLNMHILCKNKNKERAQQVENAKPKLNFKLLHLLACFESVLHDLSTINTLLGNPFPTISTKRLMSGKVLLYIDQNNNYSKEMTEEEKYELKRMKDFIQVNDETAKSKNQED